MLASGNLGVRRLNALQLKFQAIKKIRFLAVESPGRSKGLNT